MSAGREYRPHDWRADLFTLIRGNYCATVERAWCVDTERARQWRWNVFRTDSDDCASIVPDDIKQYDFTFDDAMAAAEKFIADHAPSEALIRAVRFEDVQ